MPSTTLKAKPRKVTKARPRTNGKSKEPVALNLSKVERVIFYVTDFNRAVAFYRDTLGFTLKFTSPEWSEFATGETTLALHRASAEHPPGKVELGINVPDLHAFYKEMSAKGVQFPMPPARQDFGGELARFTDSEGARVSVSGPFPSK